MNAIEELREAAERMADAIDRVLADVAPDDDPMPVLLIEGAETALVMGLPLDLNDGDLKDVLFGAVVPKAIELHKGTFAGFASFAWLTDLSVAERDQVAARLKEWKVDPTDSAGMRKVVESLGITISGEDRRVEVCTITAASPGAEAMIVGRVVREDDEHPYVEWSYEPPEGSATGAVFTEVGSMAITGPGFGGRVIEGLREGIQRAAALTNGHQES